MSVNPFEVVVGRLFSLSMTVLLIIIPIALGLQILMLIAQMKINKKAFREEWLALIPDYSRALVGGKVSNFWIFLVFYFASGALGAIISYAPSFGAFVGLLIAEGITSIVAVIFKVIITHRLSKAFGQGIGFTLGLLFLPIVFYPMLAWGRYIFVGDDGDAKTPYNGREHGYSEL